LRAAAGLDPGSSPCLAFPCQRTRAEDSVSTKPNRLAAVLLLFVALGLVACASEERGAVQDQDRGATRAATPAREAPPETNSAATEKTSALEASAEPSSPCGGSPEEVLDLQYRLINAGDYEGAYALFAERSKRVISPEQYRAFFEENAPYSVTDYSFPKVDARGEAATVEATFTMNSPSGQERLLRTQELACEGGSWRVVMREEQAAAFAGAVPAFTQEEGAAEEIAVTGVIEDAPDRADGTPVYGIKDETTITGEAPPVGYLLEGDYSAYVGQRVTVYGTPRHDRGMRVLDVSRVEKPQ
jgi:hypothetical protein